MKLEVGKFYRLRNGQKVQLVGMNRPHPAYPIVGWDNTGFLLSWTAIGLSPSQPAHDILAEWTAPPPPEVFVNMYEDIPHYSVHATSGGASRGARWRQHGAPALAIGVRYVLATDNMQEERS